MLASIVDAEIVVRDTVFDRAPADLRFAFDFTEAHDAGQVGAGPLFSQNDDFFLFETEIDDSGRAGPSQASPIRCWGHLALALYTKDGDRKFAHLRQLEGVSRWFADQTLQGVRFRSFIPTSASRVMGFTSYGGVISFAFEISRG